MRDSKRSAVVEKILQHASPRDEPEVEDARESFQEARARSREVVMLDVKLEDGRIESFPYAWLRRVRFQPGDTLLLHFGGIEVKVEGRNLSRLRAVITEHRARFIQEGTESEQGLKPEDAAHIDRIGVDGDDDG